MGGAHGYFFVPAAALISPRSLSQRTLRRTRDLFYGEIHFHCRSVPWQLVDMLSPDAGDTAGNRKTIFFAESLAEDSAACDIYLLIRSVPLAACWNAKSRYGRHCGGNNTKT
jgi:hypothetical protein